jgi:peptidylprolyl isomerase
MRFDSKLFRLAAIMTVIFAMALITGCGGSDSADGNGNGIAAGDTVSVTYKGTLDDGTLFDSSATGQPLKFVAGAGEMIPGFDMAVMGMTLNEKKTFTIPDSLAYGPRRDPVQQKVPSSFFPEDTAPEVGLTIQLQGPQGQPFPGTVVEIATDSVTLSLDYNPPLAGENLTFDIEIVGIN